jgi:hypothetical protein
MKSSLSLLIAILTLLMLSCNNTPKPNFTVQNDTVTVDSSVFDSSAVQQNVVQEEYQQPIVEEKSTNEIVNVRIQNSFVNTDKTIPCSIILDETNKIMTLEGIQSTDLFRMIYQGEGMFTMEFYNSDGLQATKTIYRRDDLETQTSGQIYTSRTNEIIITISNL